MNINNNVILKTLRYTLQLRLTRRTQALLLVSVLAVSVLYIKQYIARKPVSLQAAAQQEHVMSYHSQQAKAMQAYIESLNSRIKHLSLDNKRLSATGHRLIAQLETNKTNIRNKLIETKDLQVELASLDQDIIRKYESFLGQQESFLGLKSECSHSKNKDKNKKCAVYAQSKEVVDGLAVQIKFLKTKRDVLLSQIARTYGSL